MSFFLTKKQMRARTKTVTRRLGWWFLRKGDLVCAVEKGQGLKKGEKVKRICVIRIRKTNPERLCHMRPADVRREGFGNTSKRDFIRTFCRHNKIHRSHWVNRIEFDFV